jgi:allene oxide cyclase
MKRLLSSLIAIGAITLLAVAVTAWGKSPSKHHKGGKTISVIEHATTDTTTDTGAPGESAGDVLTFANDVFDRNDSAKVGTDQGYCIRVVAGASYECNWSTFLHGGQIVVEGPFYDAKNSVLAITGGTGRYRNARGSMQLESLEGGTKYRCTFHVLG